MDKSYWENYYNAVGAKHQPSNFAKYVLSEYIQTNQSLIELGCGNGRDSIYFANHGVKVLATDQCAVSELKDTSVRENFKFLVADFSELEDMEAFDVIYSRFTLHSITKEQQDRVLNWSYRHLATGGHFCIEVRGHKNEIFKLGTPVPGQEDAFFYNDHYRRFVERETLLDELTSLGFEVVMHDEDKGFAPYEDTDYTFLRIVVTKK